MNTKLILFFASIVLYAQTPLPSPIAAGGGGGGGAGDVVGPASATDNAVVRFDLTTGKLVQNSVVTIADTTGNISTPGKISTGIGGADAGVVDMGQGTAPAVEANAFGWGAPTTMTTSVRLVSPNAVPAANQVMLFPAPTANVSSWTWSNLTLASAQFANQGTTTTVAHGNAAGNPSWAAVVSADLNITTSTCSNQFVRSIAATAVGTCASIVAADLPVVPLTTGTSVTLTNNSRYFVCTGTCTVTVPVPVAGVQYCVRNGNNVATVITLAALGSSAMYENTAGTAYGTAGTGTLVSGGAAGDKVCIVGLDSTHYLTMSYNGTWTAS